MPLTWLSLASSTVVYSKAIKVVTLQLINDNKFKLTNKLFDQILNTPNVEPFYKVSNKHALHMVNEMGYQPVLTKMSDFNKSCLPGIWNFLFVIYLRRLTDRNVGLYKAKLEIYALVAGRYNDYWKHECGEWHLKWEEFVKSIGNMNEVNSISCACYWSLVLQYAYDKEGIAVPEEGWTTESSLYHFP